MDFLWSLDKSLFRAIHSGLHADWLDPVFWIITSTGLGWVQTVILSLVGFDWLKFPKVRWDWIWPIAWSGVLSGLASNQLKHFLVRERPSNYVWAHPQESIYFSSFPSGHTAGSFGLAFAFVLVYPGPAKWKWVAVAWASLVGISRIYRGVHWPTDVIGGAADGLICACIAVGLWRLMRGQAASAAVASD